MTAYVGSYGPVSLSWVYEFEVYGPPLASFDILDRFMASVRQDGQNLDPDPATFARISDISGRIQISVPMEWVEVTNEPIVSDGEVIGTSLSATSDAKRFLQEWGISGVKIWLLYDLYSEEFDTFLDDSPVAAECTFDERAVGESESLLGKYNIWKDCGGATGTYYLEYILVPKAGSPMLVLAEIVTRSQRDLTVVDPMLQSLVVLDALHATSAKSGASITVSVNELSVRSGPSASNPAIAVVTRGTELTPIGQYNDCKWLRIATGDGIEGWISGNKHYIQLTGACAEIPAASP